MPIVLDACAIIAYLRDEPGAEIVEEALLNERCFVHALNLCEVYKDCLFRGESSVKADDLLDDLANVGVIAREDMDAALWKRVAMLKEHIRKIPYADCFALAMAERLSGTLYSSDHNDLDRVVSVGHHSIRFIR